MHYLWAFLFLWQGLIMITSIAWVFTNKAKRSTMAFKKHTHMKRTKPYHVAKAIAYSLVHSQLNSLN